MNGEPDDAQPDYGDDGFAQPTGRAAEIDAHVLGNLAEYLERYRSKATELTGSPHYLSADIAKELFPEYAASPEARTRNSTIFQAASTRIKEAMLRSVLMQPATGMPQITFMAGGTGAGKSTLAPRQGIVYDGNLASIKGARRKIDAALESGRLVRLLYVHRDPLQAYQHGVLPRALRYGRIVPVDAHVSTHVGAFIAFKALKRYYKNNSCVGMAGLLPPGPPPDSHQLRESILRLIQGELEKGSIPEFMAEQALGGRRAFRAS